MSGGGGDVSVLEPFVGEWSLLAAFDDSPAIEIGARATFEWLADADSPNPS